jgi:lipopolysaccharide export system protein LptA
MKRNILSFGLLVLFGVALAAAGSRVIEIEGGRQQGDLRFGPYKYTEGVKATVQKLQIESTDGSLTAPQGLEMSKAQGKRTAGFGGGVTVSRGRLTAKGPTLEYKEETGLGVLAGPTNIVQKPEKAGEDDVFITALKATFDVDTNVSTSEGSVKLVNGKQSALSSKVVFDEEKNIGCLTDGKTVTLIREPKKASDVRLVITAKEARVNTDKNTLIASGGVTLVAGKNTTTGDSLYFDDEKNTAYIVGKPAKNVDKKSGGSISGTTLVNNTAKEQVQVGKPFIIPVDAFKCPSDR